MALSFSALEIGQGDAFLLEKDEWKCLFDSGGSKDAVVTLLKKKKINHINLAICSHNDFDHTNGFIGILDIKNNITIEEIWLPGIFGSIIQYVADNGIPRDIFGSKEYHIDNINLDALYDNESETISCDEFEDNISMYIKYWNYTHRNIQYEFWPFDMLNFKALSLLIKLKNIEEIAKLAYERGCFIRWFQPIDACTNNEVDYGFTALNSIETYQIKRIKGVKEFIYALTLSAENKYSLVFEYSEKNTPIVRFSADSDSTCQSVKPYINNIIITAPHHGSEANKIVYNTIQGSDIIWVRSDRKSSKRPCADFKSQPNKYCLACRNRNFKRELHFEFQGNSWQHIKGNSCTC